MGSHALGGAPAPGRAWPIGQVSGEPRRRRGHPWHGGGRARPRRARRQGSRPVQGRWRGGLPAGV